MKRIVTRFGIGLSVFAFAALMIFIVLPSIVSLDKLPAVDSVIQVLFCKSGETLKPSYSTYETPGTTTTSTDLQCVDSEGKGRDVSQDFLQAAFIGYLVTFLGGFVIVGIAQYFPSRQAEPIPSPPQSFHEHHNAEAQVHMHHHEPVNESTSSHLSLASRLVELKAARDAGLITQAEYDAKREEILKDA